MRNLQECTAEVFRRSEQRIQKRKNIRKRMLLGGILSVMCVIAATAALVETRPIANDSNLAPIADMTTENTTDTGNPIDSYTKVEIDIADADTRHIRTLTDPAQIAQLYGVIQSLSEPTDDALSESCPSDDAVMQEEDVSVSDNNIALNGSISFFTAEGATVTYTLTESALIDESSGRRIPLNDQQLLVFKKRIGFS